MGVRALIWNRVALIRFQANRSSGSKTSANTVPIVSETAIKSINASFSGIVPDFILGTNASSSYTIVAVGAGKWDSIAHSGFFAIASVRLELQAFTSVI